MAIYLPINIFAQNVGIGVANPQEKLHIDGFLRGNQSGAVRISTGNGYVDIGPKNTTWSHFQTDRSRYYFNKGITVDEGLIGSYSQDLQLQTSGNTRIRVLNSNGYVGIGGTPSSKLEVFNGSLRLPATSFEGAGQIQSTDIVKFANGSSAQAIYVKQISASSAWADNDTYTQINGIYSSGNLRVGGANLALFANTSTGHVGIGTSSPTAVYYGSGGRVLDLRESNDSEIAQLTVAGTGQGTGYIFVGQSDSYGGGITYNGDNTPSMPNISTDDISIFRRTAGVDYEVLHWSHNSSTAEFEGDIDLNNYKVTNMANPTNGADAATKSYVDALISGVVDPDDGIKSRGIINKGSSNVPTQNLAAGISLSGSGSGTTATDGNKTVGSSYQSFGSGNQSGTGSEGSYLQLDLGSARTISQHKIYFYNGNARYYWFKLKYSYDGTNWYYAVGNNDEWAQSAPGMPTAPGNGNMGYVTDIRVPTITARYWRLYSNGSTSNGGNHIYEWEALREANPVALDIDDHLYVGGSVDIGGTSGSYTLYVNGKIGSNGINETSDKRFKKDIQNLESSLDKVSQLRGVSYYWRHDEFPDKKFEEGRDIGVIAQEVEAIFPELVKTDKQGYKSVEYSHLVPILIEAIKELRSEKNQEIDNLRSEVESYKALLQNIDIEKLERDYSVNNKNYRAKADK